ncbi:MAG TPA: hypothetical protein VMD51_08780, partial [Mycobacterium sp.]|nr:hypothetical protein [Mycobacterium sp.]
MAGLNPKVVRYWSYSSDTCGGYATVTAVMAYGDPRGSSDFGAVEFVQRRYARRNRIRGYSREVSTTAAPRWLAPILLVASVAARLAWTYLVPNGANFV